MRAGERAALQPLQGVGSGLLVGSLGSGQTLHADGEAGGVHHGEHRGHALVRGADQPAHGVLELHGAGGRGADAHLVLDAGAADAVALAAAPAVRARHGRNLGTTNRLMPRVPGGASGSFARTRWTMFSVRSCSPALMKILVPVDAEAAVVRRHGPGADQAEVGAALRPRSGTWCPTTSRRRAWAGRSACSRVGMPRQRVVGALAQAG